MDTVRAKKLGEFLTEEFFKFQRKRGRFTSANQFAKELGVNPSSLNYWMQGLRLPTGENIYKLGNALGDEVYRIMDVPHLSTDNPWLIIINKHLPSLPPNEQEAYAEKIKKAAAVVTKKADKAEKAIT
jgi:transcriptional regulator with XRE-family HTH domain